MALEFRVAGIVLERGTRRPLPNLVVRGYDAELQYGDLLADALTDEVGHFEIAYAGSDFRELFERRPAIYFKILNASGEGVLHLTPESVIWEAGPQPFLEIEVPQHKLPPREVYGISLLDSHGRPQHEFEVGESLAVTIAGVAQSRSHLFRVIDGSNKEVFNASLISDRFGMIEPTVLWPEIGIGQPKEGGRFAHDTLEQAGAAFE